MERNFDEMCFRMGDASHFAVSSNAKLSAKKIDICPGLTYNR